MISEAEARWEIDSTLKNQNFVHRTDAARAGIYRGKLAIGHTHVDVEVEIPDLHFVKLPRVELINNENLSLEFIAHLDEDIGICYADRSLLRLDPSEPGKAILLVLELAQKTLSQSLGGRAQQEIMREYAQYWRGGRTLAMMPLGTTAVLASNETQYLLCNNNSRLPVGYGKIRDAYIFEIEGALKPTQKFIVPKTIEQLEIWYEQQALKIKISFKKLLLRLARGEVIFFAANNGIVGCSVDLKGTLKVLADKSSSTHTYQAIANAFEHKKAESKIRRFYAMNANLEDVTARNTPSQSSILSGKKITLVGCGTIGSHLARFLMQSGAGNGQPLTLIDHELLAAGNLGRHLLNFDDLGKAKAESLAKELTRFHPDVNIKAINKDISECINAVFSSDLIIDATGIENVSEFLSQKAIEERQEGREGNLLHVWLYGNGIAAQSFLNVGQNFACYSCLQPSLNKPRYGDPRKDVKEAPEIQQGSCGDTFIPFLVSAPVVAAALALEATTDYFSGNTGSRFRSRVLNEEKAKHLHDKSPKPTSECRVCGGKN